jgi:hypothetical protein
MQTVESQALLDGERRVVRDRSEQTGRQRRVDALEELEKQDTDGLPSGASR